MISMLESDTVGFYLPIIADIYGEEAKDKLVQACIDADSLADLPDPFGKMLFTAQSVVDGTYKPDRDEKDGKGGKGEKGAGVAKTFSQVCAEAEDGAKSFSDMLDHLAKFNPYHAPDSGKFSTGGTPGVILSFAAPKKPWKADSSMTQYLSTGADGKDHISPERQALYNKIINDTFKGIEKPAPGEQRSIVFMGGGGASGKSYLLDSHYIDTPPKAAKKAIHINADDIKDQLPEYKKMLAGPPEVQKEAAGFVHQESSIIANRLVKMAIARGYNVVLDGTASDVQKTTAQAKLAREAGYKVEAHYVQCPLETAMAANVKRFHDTGRYVPEDILVDAHKSVSENFEKLANKGIFDKVDLIQNNRQSPLKTIANAVKGSKLQVHDEAAYKAFEEKKNFVYPPAK